MTLPRIPHISDQVMSPYDVASAVRGLRYDRGIVSWEFQPSIGIMAKYVDRLGTDIRSFREPLTRCIKEVMIPSFQQNFAEGGRPDKWDPLSPATVKLRGTSGPILVRSGKLRRTAGQINIWTITQTFAAITRWPQTTWYGTVQQAGYGQFGKHLSAATKELGESASGREVANAAFDTLGTDYASHAKIAIPARPFIVLQDEDEVEIEEVFYKWLGERLDAVGRFNA